MTRAVAFSQVVLIEPLATMTAVEEFLWPRIFRSESELATEAAAEADAQNKVACPFLIPFAVSLKLSINRPRLHVWRVVALVRAHPRNAMEEVIFLGLFDQ